MDVLKAIADAYKTHVHKHEVVIPTKYGQGFVKVINLSDGLSVMLSDVTLRNTLTLNRKPGRSLFYILQFNEVISDHLPYKLADNHAEHLFHMHQNIVLLTNSQVASKFIMPAGVRIRSVKIILEKQHLLQYYGQQMVESFLSNYFSQLVKNGVIEPIDADCRVLLDALLEQGSSHPLPFTFATNRCMLLIEHFVQKFMKRVESQQQSFKLTDDEINRLMKAEAQLVKDYSKAPPVIEELAKLCAMSPTKLKKDFKALYGYPIYEYYQKNRMKRARALVIEGNHSIKEVGLLVGYTNLSHFAGAFKKEFGIVPSGLSAKDETLEMPKIGEAS